MMLDSDILQHLTIITKKFCVVTLHYYGELAAIRCAFHSRRRGYALSHLSRIPGNWASIRRSTQVIKL